MRRTIRALAGVLALCAALAVPTEGGAIPAWARRYGISCTTCHAPFPRLKAYGEAFAGRGFALEPGVENAPPAVEAGDELLALPRDFPIALRFDAFAQVQDRAPETDFQAPWLLKLLAGGEIAPKVGFYTYLLVEDGQLKGLEDAYVQLGDVFGLPVDVLVGQFQIADPIVKRELRLQRLDYSILTTRVGDSIVDLTYDRGVAFAAGSGLLGGVFTVTNGNGIGPSTETFDKDPYKNFSVHLASDLGPVRVGVLGYVGKERGLTGALNTTWYAGPDVVVDVGRSATITALYLERRDSNPVFSTGAATRVVTRGGFVEAVLLPQGPDGRWAVIGLYNKVSSDLAAAESESLGAALGWLYRRNVRLMAEIDRDIAGAGWAGTLGTVAAF